MTSKFRWTVWDSKTSEEETGEQPSLILAQKAAEIVATRRGSRGLSITVTGPRGASWTYSAGMRSQMVWRKV